MDKVRLFAERAASASAEVLGPVARRDLPTEIGRVLTAGFFPRVVVQAAAGLAHQWLSHFPSSGQAVRHADLGIIQAAFGIARTGTCVYQPADSNERLIALFPSTCLILLRAVDIVGDLRELAPVLDERHSRRAQTLFITGPSRTGDIEHVLTLGMQGPGRVVVALWHEDT